MGGINHQPCSEYDPEAITLSKNLSQAYASFWLGNGKIEDALLLELKDDFEQASVVFREALSEMENSLLMLSTLDVNLKDLLRLE